MYPPYIYTQQVFPTKLRYIMVNYLKQKFMAFKHIFKDDNDINEKSVIGFLSFMVMIIFACADLITGYFGTDLIINEFIYDSFTLITLGCFGIAGLEKIFGKKEKQYEKNIITVIMHDTTLGFCTRQLV